MKYILECLNNACGFVFRILGIVALCGITIGLLFGLIFALL